MSKIQLIAEWREDSPIDRWNSNRKHLNKIIKKINKWQIKHNFNSNKADILLVYIELAFQELPTEYHEELRNLKLFIDQNKAI